MQHYAGTTGCSNQDGSCYTQFVFSEEKLGTKISKDYPSLNSGSADILAWPDYVCEKQEAVLGLSPGWVDFLVRVQLTQPKQQLKLGYSKKLTTEE